MKTENENHKIINKLRSENKDQRPKKARCKKQDVKNEIREFKPGYKNSMMIKIRCKK